jgi:hypothetical protein
MQLQTNVLWNDVASTIGTPSCETVDSVKKSAMGTRDVPLQFFFDRLGDWPQASRLNSEADLDQSVCEITLGRSQSILPS